MVLSIACEWAPSLYAPRERDNAPPFGLHGTMTAVSNKIPNLSIESFCESKSLAYREYVDWRMSWTDHGDLEAFSLGFAGAGHNLSGYKSRPRGPIRRAQRRLTAFPPGIIGSGATPREAGASV